MAKKKNIKHIIGGGKGTTYMSSYYSHAVGDTMSMPEKAHKELIKFNQRQEVDRLKFIGTEVQPLIQAQEDIYKKEVRKLPQASGDSKKKISRDSSMKKFPQARQAQRVFKKRGYISSYLDLSANKPGKYGVDY